MTTREGKSLIAILLVALCVCGCVTGSSKEAPPASFLATNHAPPAIRVPSTNPLVSAAHSLPTSGGVSSADVISEATGSTSPGTTVTDGVNTSTITTSTNTALTPRTTASAASSRDTRRGNASGSRAAPTSTSRSMPTSTMIPGSDSVSRYTATDSRIGEGFPSHANSSIIRPSNESSDSSTENSFIPSSGSPFSISVGNGPESHDFPIAYSPSSPNQHPHPSPENSSSLTSSSLSPRLPTSPPNTTTPSPAPAVKRCCPTGFHMTRAGCVADSDTQPSHYNGTGQNEFFKCKNGNAWAKNKNGTKVTKSAALMIRSPFIARRAGAFCLEEVVGSDGSDLSVYYLCYADPVEEYKKRCSDPTSCVRKCCPEGKVLQKSLCVEHDHKLKLGIVDDYLDAIESESGKRVISEFPTCSEGHILSITNESERQFYVMESGVLYMPEDHQNYLSNDRYCVEYALDNHEKLSRLVFSCYAKAEEPSQWMLLSVYFRSVGLIISSVFLFITLVFYFCIAELRNLHSLSLLSHVVSLFLSQLALLMLTWMPSTPPRGLCVTTGFAVQLFFLWSFFWLNVLCFDIWRIVGQTENMKVMSAANRRGPMGLKGGPYVWYMLYAWGIPLLIFFVSLTLFLLPARLHGFLRPSFLHDRCWLSRDMEILAFFYGPIAVLLLVNLVLIMHTGLRLYRAGNMFTCCPNRCCPNKSSAASASGKFYHPHHQGVQQRFGIFSFLTICWIFEVLSWKIPPADAWAFTDILNSLQGFFVFVLFISNKQRRALVGELLGRWRMKLGVCWRKMVSLDGQQSFYLSDGPQQGTSSSSDKMKLQAVIITKKSTGQTELSLNNDGLAEDGQNKHGEVYTD